MIGHGWTDIRLDGWTDGKDQHTLAGNVEVQLVEKQWWWCWKDHPWKWNRSWLFGCPVAWREVRQVGCGVAWLEAW
jgi:hypothetical protein